jgi:hypothetical protein
MTSTYIWVVLFLSGLGYEAFSLVRSEDRHLPLTYHLRRLLRRSWVRVLAIGFWIWLPLHLAEVVP